MLNAPQARKAEAMVEKYAPSDPAADARLQDGIKHEEHVMKQVCDDFGLEMHEVRCATATVLPSARLTALSL